MSDLTALNSTPITQHPLQVLRGPSPLILDCLPRYLSQHLDQSFASYIFCGLRDGFHIGFVYGSSPLSPTLPNHPSTEEHPVSVTNHIQEELQLGRLVGQIPPSLCVHVHTSPLGLVPKPHSNKWQLIVDLSSPRGQSVNDGISSSPCSLSYASVDDAVNIITMPGRGTSLIKIDLSNAYRMVPVHPVDQPLLGIRWQGETFID